ncbi:M23 family metallopeptidase [Parvularcula marina]|uniref:M23 family peptidase n=1 Tax=Parvularcula marina TaxID=2292771 RepID=A0A371RF92_9PROT|nr:M23 family metallopeptidase [Parvularcula marina]RFB04117.1 M23 family peptidase [Parvularcula marina]
MKSVVLFPLAALSACAATAAPPVPSLSPKHEENVSSVSAVPTAARNDEDDTAPRTDGPAAKVTQTVLEGTQFQGGLLRGQTPPGSKVFLDDTEVLVDEGGHFLIGFDRDHPATAVLKVVSPDGKEERETIQVRPQQWLESSVTVAENKANPRTDFDLKKIAADKKLKDKARSQMSGSVYWLSGFVWPAEGCVSSPFGYRRIVNGKARNYHSGVDVAAPDGMSPIDYIGTPIYAPADGIVTLAEPDMFFEGGLVLIDHGQLLESAMMHMSEVLVEAGDTVEQGDLLGKVGMEGRVTGPHLHWSLKWRDRLLDPELNVEERARCTPGL